MSRLFHLSRDNASDDRGQLLISGAVVIASLLVILVVVLNGVAYSESPTTRIDGETIDRVAGLAELIESESADTLRHENTQLHTTTGSASTDVQNILTAIGSGVATHRFSSHSEVIAVDVSGVQRAFVIRQADESTLTSVNNRSNWTVGTGNGIRNATMRVDTVAPIGQASTLPQLQVTDASGATSTVYIFKDPNTGRAALGTQINQSTGEPITDCVGDGDGTPTRIVWEDTTIDSTNCGFQFGGNGTATPPYEIQIKNGDEMTGSYQFVIGTGENAGLATSGGDTTVYNATATDPIEPTEPVAYDGAYSVTVIATTDTRTVTGATTLYSAPDEPAQTPGSEAI